MSDKTIKNKNMIKMDFLTSGYKIFLNKIESKIFFCGTSVAHYSGGRDLENRGAK
jgi:hypothetical protein